MKRSWLWIEIAVYLWIAAFDLALGFDELVTDWVGRAPLFDRRYNSPWKWPKRIGEFQYVLPVIVALAIWHRRRWRGALMVLLAGGIAGAAYGILKPLIGRLRPSEGKGPFAFHPFTDDPVAFPSGHAAFAFATAVALGILMPKWRWFFYLLAAMCGVQRILEHAHHPSDVVAAALLGLGAAHLADWLCKRWLPPPPSMLVPAEDDTATGSRDRERATLA